MTRQSILFVVSILGAAVAAATILLSIPGLTVGGGGTAWPLLLAAPTFAVLAAGARRWRPTTSESG